MPKLKFTKRAIEALPQPPRGQVIYRDQDQRRFGLRVGSNSKVFIAEGQVQRRTCRVTLGRADVLGVDAARKLAVAALAEMAVGVDPNEEKKRKAREALTLQVAFDRFFETRTSLKAGTVDMYRRTVSKYLKDWAKRPLASITRDASLKRHQRIAKEHGEVTANNVMRHLRSVYNVTAAGFDEFPPNPVNILTQARAWHPKRRRRGAVTARELPAWWAAVMDEPTHARDFLLVALFTGMRRNEIARLRWEHIDLEDKALHLPSTKNGDPLDLPLPGFLIELLQARRATTGRSPWVFPGNGASGHLVETKTFTARVSAQSGTKFTLHDLRRTFITIAESLDIPHYALKRLLNHRISGDVTAGYIVNELDRLLGPVEKIEAAIFHRVASGRIVRDVA